MSPLTYEGETAVAYPAVFGGVAAPAIYYVGLQTSEIYPGASQSIANGAVIIPTAFDTFSEPGTGTNRIFVCSTAGTTDVAEPNWDAVVSGGTILDGSVIWQDVASTTSPFWLSSTPVFNEVSASEYARVEYDNNQTNFPSPSGSNPTVGTNANIIGFATSYVAWGTLAAVTFHDAYSGGNVISFAYLSKHLTISGAGITPSIPALTGLTLTVS
jgi:hypothetical protein